LKNKNKKEGKIKIMNEFKINEQMELLLQAKQNQPERFAQLPAQAKIAVGIYEGTKPTANNGLTADELLRLRGLKRRIAEDVLSPGERTSLAIEIINLEQKNIGEKQNGKNN
jgi:hypothetical protein